MFNTINKCQVMLEEKVDTEEQQELDIVKDRLYEVIQGLESFAQIVKRLAGSLETNEIQEEGRRQ